MMRALLLTTALASLPVLAADPAAAQVLGIDCEDRRYTADGKLILNYNEADRVTCEAHRTYALTIMRVLSGVRDKVSQAVRSLPPPVHGDLLDHLARNPEIDAWKPTLEDRIEVGDLLKLHPELTWLARVESHWTEGVLARSTIDASAWNIEVRACGDPGQGEIVVYLEPGGLREPWTPETIQHTLRAWLTRDMNMHSAWAQMPGILAGPPGAPVLLRPNGHERKIDGCIDETGAEGYPAPLPRGVLAYVAGLNWKEERESHRLECPDPTHVGRLWVERSAIQGVYVEADGSIHPDMTDYTMELTDAGWRVARDSCREARVKTFHRRAACPNPMQIHGHEAKGGILEFYQFREFRDPGAPLNTIDAPTNDGVTMLAPGEAHVPVRTREIFCDTDGLPPPVAPDYDEITESVAQSCQSVHGSDFPNGTRTLWRRVITYDNQWPLDDIDVSWVEDACWRSETWPEVSSRNLSCGGGYDGGSRHQARTLTWERLNYWDPKKTDINRNAQLGDTGWVTVSNSCYTDTRWTEIEWRWSGCIYQERDIVWIHRDYADAARQDNHKFREVSRTSWDNVGQACNGGGGSGSGSYGSGGEWGVDVDGDGRADRRAGHGDGGGDLVWNEGDLPGSNPGSRDGGGAVAMAAAAVGEAGAS